MTKHYLIPSLVVILVLAVLMLGLRLRERKAQFMSECRKDHKQYECDVLWGQSR